MCSMPVSNSPLSDCDTPVEEFPSHISECATPVEDSRRDLDFGQLTLQLYIQAALRGEGGVPQWEGLAAALQRYFSHGWQKDKYTLEYCENNKAFLFWNAVADTKMKGSRGC